MGAAILSTANAKAKGSKILSSGGAIKVGSGDCFATVTAKVEIRHEPFAVYTQASFYSEGGRQPMRVATIKCARN